MAAPLGIGWVVDDACAPKRQAGGAAEFARRLAEAEPPVGHRAECPSCALVDDEFACVGVVEAKLSAAAEEWLAERLPVELESLAGLLLRQNLAETGNEGKTTRKLRELGFTEAPGPFSRHWGPFFRRYTVTTDQLLEEMFLVGHVQPPHALGILVHLGAIAVDGEILTRPEDGPKLAEVFQNVESRRERTTFAISIAPDEGRSLRDLKRYLRALYATFVLDCELQVFSPV